MMVPFGAGVRRATFGRPDMVELGRLMLGGRGSKIGILLVTGGSGDGGGLLLQLYARTNSLCMKFLYLCELCTYICMYMSVLFFVHYIHSV